MSCELTFPREAKRQAVAHKQSRAAKANAEMNGAVTGRAFSIDPLAPSSAFDETLRDKLREDVVRRRQVTEDEAVDDEQEEGVSSGQPGSSGADPNERLLERNWTAPPGKRVAVPVRIEPKVYFASERTFLVSSAFTTFICSSSFYRRRRTLCSFGHD